jgi:hypothetical protein
MKKYTIAIYTGLIFLLFYNSACKKYLDVKSDSSLIVPSTLNDLQSLLDDATNMNYNTPGFGGASADEYFLEDNTYQAKTVFNQHVYTWLSYPYKYPNDWGLAYRAIYNTNICLERIALINPSQNNSQQWNNVKGSSLFFRAYYFLELSWLFAKAYDVSTAENDLGIVLRLGSDFNIPSVRSSIKTSYEKIIADTKEAALYLPDNPQQLTRPSKCAAYGLLARTYLSMRQYDSAGRYADLALQIKSGLMDYNNPVDVDANGYYPFKRFNSETVFYSTMNYFLALSHPLIGNARVDTVLYSSYDNNDLRKTIFFKATGNYYQFRGNYAADFGLFSGIGTDELLLTRAECLARASHITEALNDIKLLWSKRFVGGAFIPLNASTTGELLPIILQERQKELLFRGSIRWMDIKRLNKENALITLKRFVQNDFFTLPPNDNRYALQIPVDVIELSGIKQN